MLQAGEPCDQGSPGYMRLQGVDFSNYLLSVAEVVEGQVREM